MNEYEFAFASSQNAYIFCIPMSDNTMSNAYIFLPPHNVNHQMPDFQTQRTPGQDHSILNLMATMSINAVPSPVTAPPPAAIFPDGSIPLPLRGRHLWLWIHLSYRIRDLACSVNFLTISQINSVMNILIMNVIAASVIISIYPKVNYQPESPV